MCFVVFQSMKFLKCVGYILDGSEITTFVTYYFFRIIIFGRSLFYWQWWKIMIFSVFIYFCAFSGALCIYSRCWRIYVKEFLDHYKSLIVHRTISWIRFMWLITAHNYVSFLCTGASNIPRCSGRTLGPGSYLTWHVLTLGSDGIAPSLWCGCVFPMLSYCYTRIWCRIVGS